MLQADLSNAVSNAWSMFERCSKQCTQRNATYATNATGLRPGHNTHVLNAPLPVQTDDSASKKGAAVRFLVRKKFSPMYGSPGMYWSVEHPSLPAYFHHRLHFYTWADAIDYATAKAIEG